MSAIDTNKAFRSPQRAIAGTDAQADKISQRALIHRQIRDLQKQATNLSKQLQELGFDPASMARRIELEKQMRAIEDQIKALQMLLVQTDVDDKVRDPESDTKAASEQEQAPPKAENVTVGVIIDTKA